MDSASQCLLRGESTTLTHKMPPVQKY